MENTKNSYVHTAQNEWYYFIVFALDFLIYKANKTLLITFKLVHWLHSVLFLSSFPHQQLELGVFLAHWFIFWKEYIHKLYIYKYISPKYSLVFFLNGIMCIFLQLAFQPNIISVRSIHIDTLIISKSHVLMHFSTNGHLDCSWFCLFLLLQTLSRSRSIVSNMFSEDLRTSPNIRNFCLTIWWGKGNCYHFADIFPH